MKLGTATQIIIGVEDLYDSFYFYNKMGFEKVLEDSISPIPWMQISDWSILMLLSEDQKEYIALTYFAKDMDRIAFELEVRGVPFVEKVEKDGKFLQGVILSPDGLGISLINHDPTHMFQPGGLKLTDFEPTDIRKVEKYPNDKCGVFGEISHPVKDLRASLAFWSKLGFEPILVKTEPYPWATLTDDLNIIGLHQTDFFTYPAITYFACDMEKRIRKLRVEGVNTYDFTGREYDTNNVMVRSPDGQHFFLLTMEG